MEESARLSFVRFASLFAVLVLLSLAGYVYFQENKIAEIQNAAAQNSTFITTPSESDPEFIRTKKNIIGMWQSNTDANSRVLFFQNGTFRELYQGNFVDKGSWSIHLDLKGTDHEFEDYGDTLFLKEASISDNVPTYFTISTDGNILKLGSLTLQKMLIYTRVH